MYLVLKDEPWWPVAGVFLIFIVCSWTRVRLREDSIFLMAEVLAAATMAISSATALFTNSGLFETAPPEHDDETWQDHGRDSVGSLGSQTAGTEMDVLGPTHGVLSSPVIRSAARRSSERRNLRMNGKVDAIKSSPALSLAHGRADAVESVSGSESGDPPPLSLPDRESPVETESVPAVIHASNLPPRNSTSERGRDSCSSDSVVVSLRPTNPSTPLSSNSATTVTSRVICSFSDATRFLALTRDGDSERSLSFQGHVGTKVKAPHCAASMSSDNRTVFPSRPQLVLVLARGNDGVVRHLSAYQVLGRAVGVEWARGVPTWSNRSPGLHVLQEFDEGGMPSCPAVFEALPVDARGRVNDSDGSRGRIDGGDSLCRTMLFYGRPPGE